MRQLECNKLSLGYENSILIDDLSFAVEEGDYLCIVGENGAGKSTLMRTILHLQKPINGTVNYGDNLKENEIGYLPQQTVVQKDFPASVYEVVLSGCQSKLGKRAFYTKDHKALAKKNMERLGIKDLSSRCYRSLSGGQQQRVLLARALCATEKILLLDEPVAGLDPMVTNEMYELIKGLNEQGITIIMISHDITTATKYAKHILHISGNYFYGTVDEYKNSPTGKAFLAGGVVC